MMWVRNTDWGEDTRTGWPLLVRADSAGNHHEGWLILLADLKMLHATPHCFDAGAVRELTVENQPPYPNRGAILDAGRHAQHVRPALLVYMHGVKERVEDVHRGIRGKHQVEGERARCSPRLIVCDRASKCLGF